MRFAPQNEPAQHGWVAAPQGTQLLLASQANGSAQTAPPLPSQHGSLSCPQATQLPFWAIV